jgi:hypothetical protein
MKHIWRITINQFLVATRDNYKKANKLSGEHNNRLKSAMDNHPGDPDYAIVYNRYHPLHVELSSAYLQWKSQAGTQKGDTLSVKQLIKLLPARINKFDLKIQEFHEKGSPRYMQLFPSYHKPFYRGSKDSRIVALGILSGAIGDEADLAPVKLLVDSTHNELLLAKAQQTGSKMVKSTDSSRVEQARIAAMIGQYQNMGFFINKFPTEPQRMEALFDVVTLTTPEQMIWKGQLKPKEIRHLLVRTLEIVDIIRVKSIGNGDLSVYLASYQGATDSKPVITKANHALRFEVSDFEVSDLSQHRFMTIVNNSETEEVRFFLQLY